MSQHDLNIANQTRTNFRQDLNSALEAVASKQSGTGDPTITYPFQEKIDTSASPAVVYIRNAANTAWQRIGYIDGTTGQLIMDDATDAVNSDTVDGKHYSDFSDKLVHDITLSGTDIYTGTLPSGVSDYYNKMKVAFVVPNANTDANPTINLSSKGAKKTLGRNGAAIIAGDLPVGIAICEYDSSADSGNGGWLLLNVSVSMKVSQSGAEVYALATGTDTYAATLSPAITAYATGLEVHIKISNTNTSTAPTLNLNSIGAKKIFKPIAAALVAGDLEANGQYTFIYDASLDSNNGGWTVKNSRVLGISENTDKVDGYHAGNSSGQVPVSNGTVCSNLNADLLDGQHYSSTCIKNATGNGDNKPAMDICLNGSYSSTGIPYINYSEYFAHGDS